jgi:hypothetical protein
MNGKPGHLHADPPKRNDLYAAALMKFPRLQQYGDNMTVIQGRPMIAGDSRQLESYPPDESWNPVPGKFTTEIYNNTAPLNEQVNMVAGDMLHNLGRVDPKWDAMKRDVLPPELLAPDLYNSRADEYLMGYITPDAADEWRKGGAYNAEQKRKLDLMVKYLMGNE